MIMMNAAHWAGALALDRSIPPLDLRRIPMITFVRTAVAQSGKSLELVAFAKEVSEVINRVIGEKPIVAVRFGGNANEVAWISEVENFDQLSTQNTKLLADADYRAMLKKAEHVVVSGMTHDQIWRHI
jgi:hypothetical protein